MAPSMRDLQLTAVNGSAAADDMEDVRLLDSYEDRTEDNLLRIEEGMKRIQVRITGMTCAACSTSVEGALMAVNGVVKASVALLQNKADVVFDPNSVKMMGCCKFLKKKKTEHYVLFWYFRSVFEYLDYTP